MKLRYDFYDMGSKVTNYVTNNFDSTKDQRLAAAYRGWNSAVYAVQNNYTYSWNELHARFIKEIKSVTGGRIAQGEPTKETFPESI